VGVAVQGQQRGRTTYLPVAVLLWVLLCKESGEGVGSPVCMHCMEGRVSLCKDSSVGVRLVHCGYDGRAAHVCE